MDIISTAFGSLEWLIAPLGIGIVVAVTLLTLSGIPGRMVLWLESELSARRGTASGRMSL